MSVGFEPLGGITVLQWLFEMGPFIIVFGDICTPEIFVPVEIIAASASYMTGKKTYSSMKAHGFHRAICLLASVSFGYVLGMFLIFVVVVIGSAMTLPHYLNRCGS